MVDLPRYAELYKSTVQILDRNPQGITISRMEFEVAADLGLTAEQRSIPHQNDVRSEFQYRLAWARTHLKRAGIACNPRRGIWQLKEPEAFDQRLDDRLDVLIESVSAKEAEPLAPDPGPGPAFAPTPRGFENVPTLPTDRERADPAQIALHRAILRRIRSIDQNISRIQNTHTLLFDEYVDYATFVSNDIDDIDVPTIWSVGSALTDMIGRLQTRYDNAVSSDKLGDTDDLPDDLILAALAQLSRDHAAFIMGFAQGRDLAARAVALSHLGFDAGEHGRRAKAVLAPMLSVAGLLAKRANRMITMIDRALNTSDEKTIALVGSATAVATRSVVSFGRAVAPLLGPIVVGSAVIGTPLDIAMKLSGDPNWETLRAAMIFLRDNANVLASFAGHDPVMRRWLEWLIDQIKLHGSSIDNDAGADVGRR